MLKEETSDVCRIQCENVVFQNFIHLVMNHFKEWTEPDNLVHICCVLFSCPVSCPSNATSTIHSLAKVFSPFINYYVTKFLNLDDMTKESGGTANKTGN